MRCRHEPRPLYQINRKSLAAVVLAPHRAQDWRVCTICGHVGLASRNTGKVHWRSHADPDLVQRAERWNAWAAQQQ
jgi:hypothetical protein